MNNRVLELICLKRNLSKDLLENLADTCPGTLVPDTLVSKKGRETRDNEWVGKEKQDLPEGGNK